MTRIHCLAVLAIALSVPAEAAGAQVSPVRVEFTRPGGMPGNARAIARPSEVYMIAPAQPVAAPKRRKAR